MVFLGKIIVLDRITADKIAAGEVIERPSSVVKELVENSLDAGAKNIVIDLSGSGIKRITVADDGCGMSNKDLELALKRHATSKIAKARDLHQIKTLGFRGEALPSIASVSKVTIITKPRGNIEGMKLVAQDGRVIDNTPAGCPDGTVVTIKDLFYNTPVRRKFLKADRYENTAVVDVLTKMALARPDVRFEYNYEGRRKLTSSGNGNLLDTVNAVLGSQIAQDLIKIEANINNIGIGGYLGKPLLSRSNRKHQYIFINKRPVKNLNITYTVESSYGELIPRGRYPVYVLSLHIPVELIDANVHPAKLEVRLQNEKAILQVIKNAVRQAIFGRETVAQLIFSNKRSDPSTSYVNINRNFDQTYPDTLPENKDQIFLHEQIADNTGEYNKSLEGGIWLEPLAQLKGLYILANGPEGLYIIDQHAAHERVLYEQTLDKMKKGSLKSQMLATPLILELSNKQIELLYNHIIAFRDAGFIVEEFGRQSILIRGTPDTGHIFNPQTVILDILDYMEEHDAKVDRTIFLRELVSSIACKDAIKAGDHMQLDSMVALTRDLLECDNPYSCPHGRPTMFNITYREINKKLQRTT